MLQKQQNKFFFDFLVILTFEQAFFIIYTYKNCGDDNVKIEKAPGRIRTFAACLWVLPALFLSYFFQNRVELFCLGLDYVGVLLCTSDFDRSELSGTTFPRFIALFPVILNSYYFISYLHIQPSMPSLSDIFLFLLFFIPCTLFLFIIFNRFIGPIAMFPVYLISSFFVFIFDAIHTFLKRSNHIFKFCVIALIGISIAFAWVKVPNNFSISPLPPITTESQEESEETEIVYISTYGECYHSNPHCSGMKYVRQVTLSKAKKTGRRACSKCYRKKH